jgi:hypothetical protein
VNPPGPAVGDDLLASFLRPLASQETDDATLCAALLHDVVEDTPCTLAIGGSWR